MKKKISGFLLLVSHIVLGLLILCFLVVFLLAGHTWGIWISAVAACALGYVIYDEVTVVERARAQCKERMDIAERQHDAALRAQQELFTVREQKLQNIIQETKAGGEEAQKAYGESIRNANARIQSEWTRANDLQRFIDDNKARYMETEEAERYHQEIVAQLHKQIEERERQIEEANRILTSVVPLMEGTVYERYTAYKLMALGWSDISFTKTTGDFGGDVIGKTPEGKVACVQCKRYAGTVGVEAVYEAHAGKDYYDCEEAYVCTTSNFTDAARTLARKIGVQLIVLK